MPYKAPSPIYKHWNITAHHISVDNFIVVGRESESLTRTRKGALFIRVNDPSLHRNIGKYQLPHISDEVLFNTPECSSSRTTISLHLCFAVPAAYWRGPWPMYRSWLNLAWCKSSRRWLGAFSNGFCLPKGHQDLRVGLGWTCML